jgi:PTS system cellobiose-specific IIA component
MDSALEEIIMNLIVGSGSARSYAMEAIACAKEGDFKGAHEALDNAEEEMAKAHGGQTALIQKAAKGESVEINLFMVHAQDHVMTSMLARDLAREIVELHERLSK